MYRKTHRLTWSNTAVEKKMVLTNTEKLEFFFLFELISTRRTQRNDEKVE